MLLSIDNFKSIEHVVGIDLSDLTVLAGVNSSGKSSLIQALLLLKQTLNSSSSEMLNLNGPYVYASSLMDLMHNKKVGKMRFGLCFDGTELKETEVANVYKDNEIESLFLEIAFQINKESFNLAFFHLKITCKEDILLGDNKIQDFQIIRKPRKGTYDIVDNGGIHKDFTLDSYSFANFFPIFAHKESRSLEIPLSKIVRDSLNNILGKVVYIAPQRVAPVLSRSYLTDVETRYVLPDGENTRFILDNLSNDKENFDLIKFWLCNRFHLAKDLIIIRETGKRYRVVITTNEGVKVDLMHMGFGLSQILPIITQGCISCPNSLLIVEDPDVHMHPSIQAAMSDFFLFLCLERKVSVLVETHSDHFITRLRRRIAEKGIDAKKVHLIFVINDYGSSEYKSIPLSDEGRIEGSMPPNFLDTRDTDFKAILEANRR